MSVIRYGRLLESDDRLFAQGVALGVVQARAPDDDVLYLALPDTSPAPFDWVLEPPVLPADNGTLYGRWTKNPSEWFPLESPTSWLFPCADPLIGEHLRVRRVRTAFACYPGQNAWSLEARLRFEDGFLERGIVPSSDCTGRYRWLDPYAVPQLRGGFGPTAPMPCLIDDDGSDNCPTGYRCRNGTCEPIDNGENEEPGPCTEFLYTHAWRSVFSVGFAKTMARRAVDWGIDFVQEIFYDQETDTYGFRRLVVARIDAEARLLVWPESKLTVRWIWDPDRSLASVEVASDTKQYKLNAGLASYAYFQLVRPEADGVWGSDPSVLQVAEYGAAVRVEQIQSLRHQESLQFQTDRITVSAPSEWSVSGPVRNAYYHRGDGDWRPLVRDGSVWRVPEIVAVIQFWFELEGVIIDRLELSYTERDPEMVSDAFWTVRYLPCPRAGYRLIGVHGKEATIRELAEIQFPFRMSDTRRKPPRRYLGL